MTANRVLEMLRREENPVIPDPHIKWMSSSGSGWIAIWPNCWPTGPGKWSVYYCIWLHQLPGTAEQALVGIAYDGQDGRRVKERLCAPAGSQRRNDLLRREEFVSRGLDELPKIVEEAAQALIGRIQESFQLLGEAFRQALPEKWEQPDQPQ